MPVRLVAQWQLWQWLLFVGLPFAAISYTIQETFIHRRKLRPTGLGLKPERRHRPRATEVAGATLEQQAANLAAAIDVMVAFIDGPARGARVRSCVREVSRLLPAERRGELTASFIAQAEKGGPAEAAQELAEEVCVQMAVELRAVLARAKAQQEDTSPAPTPQPAPPSPPHPHPRPVDEEEAVASPAPAPVAPALPRWARATAELEEMAAATPAAIADPTPATAPARRPAARRRAAAVKPAAATKPAKASRAAKVPGPAKDSAPKKVSAAAKAPAASKASASGKSSAEKPAPKKARPKPPAKPQG